VPCVPTASQPTGQPLPSGQCPTGTEATPASLAGLQPQDTVLAIDGRQVQAWNQITDLVTGRSGETITVTIDRAGVQQEIPVTVAQIERPVVDEAGQPTGEVVPSGFLGVRPAFEYVPQPWSSVPETMWDLTVASVVALISLPVRLYELVVDTLIGGGERAVDGPVSVVGVSRLGGEIAAMDEPVNAKIATFLSLAASLNLFLFLFNLLPVLPLDGGHIAGALVEGARRQLARLRGRPDPGPVDVARLLPVAYVVASVLIAMGVIVIWADIVKPISLG